MEYIEADCTIVLGGVTLLELGVDLMEDESSIARSQLTQQVQPIRAAFGIEIDRGNVRHELTWIRVKQFDSADAARKFRLSHAASLPRTPGDCVLTFADDSSATLSNAILSGSGYSARTHAGLFVASYHLTCGQISTTF